MPEKTVVQKMLLKPHHHLLLVNLVPDLRAVLGPLTNPPADEAADAILLFAANQTELEQHLAAAKTRLAPGGLLWVIYYKGTSKKKGDIHRDSINAYAHEIGLEGVGMISINEDLSALRLKVMG